jgi:hypothetical protein
MTRRVGRPTIVTDELIAKAWKYAEGAWEEDEVIPTVEGLSDYIDIHKDTLYAREEFSDVLATIKRRQAKILLSGGLRSELNNTLTRLILASKHGYVEKTATDVTSGGEKITPILGGNSVISGDDSDS